MNSQLPLFHQASCGGLQAKGRRTVSQERDDQAHQLREAAMAYSPPVAALPRHERPAERLRLAGPAALSVTELLSVLLGTPHQRLDAERLLVKFGNLTGLARAGLPELEAGEGIGPATAARLKAALELGRRAVSEGVADRPAISSPADAAQLLLAEMAPLPKEQLRVLVLDTRNRLVANETVYLGSANTTHMRLAEIFQPAIVRHAAAIIVAHNHPSGDPAPSPEDVAVTRSLIEAGKLLDIEVLDHLVIGQGRFVSLKERGLGFNA